MRVQKIMTADPVCVTPETRIRDAARLMRDKDVGMLPVVDDGQTLVGVITDRDITIRYVAEGRSGDDAQVRDVMTDTLTTCPADTDVKDVMDMMGRDQVRRIPIVDERGGIVGVVAQADILLQTKDVKAAGRTVEQISEP